MSEQPAFRVWANVYRSVNGAMGSVHATRELADQMAARDRVACVEFYVWDGLGVALARLANGEQK
jgi:hypothetical protein